MGLLGLAPGHGSWRGGLGGRVFSELASAKSGLARLDLQRYHVVYSGRPFDLVIHWTPITFIATGGVGGVTVCYVTAVVEEELRYHTQV